MNEISNAQQRLTNRTIEAHTNDPDKSIREAIARLSPRTDATTTVVTESPVEKPVRPPGRPRAMDDTKAQYTTDLTSATAHYRALSIDDQIRKQLGYL